MRNIDSAPELDGRLAARLKALRLANDWSLDDLAGKSSISRATLSRLENASVSPTTAVLGKLCAVFGLSLSQLMLLVEDSFTPLVARDTQPIWIDDDAGFQRRVISPPGEQLRGEAIHATLSADQCIYYQHPPRRGLEHHLFLLSGQLEVTVDSHAYALRPGDCLRYILNGSSQFRTNSDTQAEYLLFMV